MCVFFFFTDPATTEIYTLSLHDALPISTWDAMTRPAAIALLEIMMGSRSDKELGARFPAVIASLEKYQREGVRSEEHTSELQSHVNLVCRLLLEKKKKKYYATCFFFTSI